MIKKNINLNLMNLTKKKKKKLLGRVGSKLVQVELIKMNCYLCYPYLFFFFTDLDD